MAMSRVLIYFKEKQDPVSFLMNGNVSQTSNLLLRSIKANKFFSVQTENGVVILQSSEIAGLYIEKD